MKFSQTTSEIFKALSEFRKELVQPKKDGDNPQFRSKYVPLENVTDAIDKVAPEFGLAYIQNISSENDYLLGVQTIITHESGEYIMSDWLYLDARPILKGGAKGNMTAHSQGSAITYGRRYSLSTAFGIASEVDDDGNDATGAGNENTPYQNKEQQELQSKKDLLANESPVFEKFGISRTSFYAGLGQRLGVKDAISVPLNTLYETIFTWKKELEQEREKSVEEPLSRGELMTNVVKLKNDLAKQQNKDVKKVDEMIYKQVGKDNISHFTNDDLKGVEIMLTDLMEENSNEGND